MPKMSSMNACEIEPTSALSLWIFTCGTPALLMAPSMADVTNCAKMSTADGMATWTPI